MNEIPIPDNNPVILEPGEEFEPFNPQFLETNQLEESIRQWARDRGIMEFSNPSAQTLKGVAEMGELADAILKGEEVDDHVGDIVVCLILVAAMHSRSLNDCLNVAWKDIKDRKGHMSANGAFVKEEPTPIALYGCQVSGQIGIGHTCPDWDEEQQLCQRRDSFCVDQFSIDEISDNT